jgi:transcriptional regulator with XRE-family HTH domain
MRHTRRKEQTLLPAWQTENVSDDHGHGHGPEARGEDMGAAGDAGSAGGLGPALAAVGPRLRTLRRQRGVTLTELSATTGISVSTLSRLESGDRRPTLELLLPLATAHAVTLDELVGAPPTGDPRVHLRPVTRGGMTMLPLTRRAGGIQAYKLVIPGDGSRSTPDPQVHEGYEWLYVLNGRLRIVLGEHDFILSPGEAAEFDTRVPHWFGSADDEAVEILSLFGRQGERAHLRARPAAR